MTFKLSVGVSSLFLVTLFGQTNITAIRPTLQIGASSVTPLASPSPSRMKVAYGMANVPNQGAGQVIGIVVAFDQPNIEEDLSSFDTQFALPPCTTANGCFEKVYASGTQPTTDDYWAMETSLDVEWAHAIAPQAKILLVEASSAVNTELFGAVDVAVQRGASVVSMSFAQAESSAETQLDSHFNSAPGVIFVA